MEDATQEARNPWLAAGLAVLAATAALVVWGMLFWAVLYEPIDVYSELPDADAIADTLLAAEVQTGTYFYPWPRNTEATRERWIAGHKQGPFFELRFVREGVDPESAAKLLLGTLHHTAVAAVACGLLFWVGAALRGSLERAGFVFVAGLLGTLHLEVGDPIWFHFPSGYSVARTVYALGGFAVMAAVLARLTPRRAP